MDIALVGAGNVGTAVSCLLARNGHRVVAIASRGSVSARRAADRLDAEIVGMDRLPPADVFLLGVPEGAIEEVAGKIVTRVGPGAYVCHFAGSVGVAPLRQAVAERGARGCAIHPVQACPTVDIAIERLPGSAWGVTCSDPGAEEAMFSLVADAGGVPVSVPEDVRPLWHAAAVMTSNGIAGLIASGEALLNEIGIDDPMAVLGPIAAGTVRNARAGGGGAATLTGPAVRKEVETIARHVRALRDLPDTHYCAYRFTILLIANAASHAGRLTAEETATIMAVLE